MRLGVLRTKAVDALPFTREKLRHCLLVAGLRPVEAGQATASISQQLRSALPSELEIVLDEQRQTLVLNPKSITGRYYRLRLPCCLSDDNVRLIGTIIARLTREELLHDLERQVLERTTELARERELSERLLKNILPEPIAARMKAGETIADSHEASVLFADICGFTALARNQQADETVKVLDRVFRRFDQIAQRHELEKIKTIGDCYMAAAGIPLPLPDHVDRAILMGLEIISSMEELRADLGLPINVRIGVHTGPLVAGVIGEKKYSYDVWGDTVNVASRMESQGVVGSLQVSDDVKQLLGKRFTVEERGMINLKNRGEMRTWLVLGIAPLTA